MGLVWEEKTSEIPVVQGRKRPFFPCWPSTTYLIKSLSVFGGPIVLVKSLQQSASETALCVDIRPAAIILTNLLSKQLVCLFTPSTRSRDKYVHIPRASVKLLVTYLMYTPLCKVYVLKYYQAGYIYKHPTNLYPDTLTARPDTWMVGVSFLGTFIRRGALYLYKAIGKS